MKQIGFIATACMLLVASSVSFAEMSSVRLNAKVKSFDDKFVTIQLNKRAVRVPREIVGKRELKAGSMIQLTFRGDQIDYLFSNLHVGDSKERSPASENEK